MRAALTLIAVAVLAPGVAGAQGLPRLEREVFDVIAPSERVTGERGHMRMVQRACRSGPNAWARRRIVDVAAQEWGWFGFQSFDATAVETRRLPDGVVGEAVNPPLSAPRLVRHAVRFGAWESEGRTDSTIAGYWSATPDGHRILDRQNRAWRDLDGEVFWVEPWSAAFISWVMCEAGLGGMDQFRRDIAHWRYVDQAIEARDTGDERAAYVAHDVGEVPLSPGDLICNARSSAAYRSLGDRRRDLGQRAPTHCDIVVRVDAAAMTMAVIGGNVVNGVSLTVLPLSRDEAGRLRPLSPEQHPGARAVFAHLSLRSDPIEDLALDNSPTLRALSGAAPRAARATSRAGSRHAPAARG